MSATLRKPLIVVEPAWTDDANTRELVAYVDRDEDTSRKVVNSVAIDDGTRGIEHLVSLTVEQFNRHAREAELDGMEQFRDFTKCLDGSTLSFWEQVMNDPDDGYDEEDQTTDAFKEAVGLLYDAVCGHNDMRDTQLFWMSHGMKKPQEMSPRDFFFRFKRILSATLELHGNFQEPNDHEKKTMLFNAFPGPYKQKFQESAMTIEDKTSDEIVNYFQTLHENEVKSGKLFKGNSNGKRKKDDKESNGNGPRISNKKQRGRDNRRNRNNRDNNHHGNGRTRWNDACPIHKHVHDHKWGECFNNPDSNNFREPSRRDTGNKQRSNNNSRNGNGSGGRSKNNRDDRSSDAHYYDDGDERSNRKSKSSSSSSKKKSSSRRRSYSEDEGSVDNHYTEYADDNRVSSSIFDEE